MGLEFDPSPGQTPLNDEDIKGLLIPSVSTQGALNELEQKNIEKAILWSLGRKFDSNKIFSEKFIKQLHLKMFGDVWKWAGEFRKTNTNIGVNYPLVSLQLRMLVDDARFWLKHQIYEPDEFTLRFKHRLVAIHCFPNGNGRHSRLVADIIITNIFRKPEFTWGSANIIQQGEARKLYIQALQAADQHDMSPLLAFARL